MESHRGGAQGRGGGAGEAGDDADQPEPRAPLPVEPGHEACRRRWRAGARAGVVGAGAMGGGIAWALSNCGIDVRMKDISWEAIAAGMGAASKCSTGRSCAKDDPGGEDTCHASDFRVRGVHGLRAAGLRCRGRDRGYGRQEEGPARDRGSCAGRVPDLYQHVSLRSTRWRRVCPAGAFHRAALLQTGEPDAVGRGGGVQGVEPGGGGAWAAWSSRWASCRWWRGHAPGSW